MPFEPGQSGNPGGRRKVKPFREAMDIELRYIENEEDSPAKRGSLRWNARQLLMEGTPQSVQAVRDTMDGKPAQTIVGDDDADPLRVITEIRRTIVEKT